MNVIYNWKNLKKYIIYEIKIGDIKIYYNIVYMYYVIKI